MITRSEYWVIRRGQVARLALAAFCLGLFLGVLLGRWMG